MSLADRPLNVAILAVPEVTASALFGMLDLFASAGRDWSFLLSGVAGEQRMRPYEETKQMLETGDAPVEAVAAEVGYQDTSFFGRLFRRRVGLTPAQYRRRFSSLRRALEKP